MVERLNAEQIELFLVSLEGANSRGEAITAAEVYNQHKTQIDAFIAEKYQEGRKSARYYRRMLDRLKKPKGAGYDSSTGAIKPFRIYGGQKAWDVILPKRERKLERLVVWLIGLGLAVSCIIGGCETSKRLEKYWKYGHIQEIQRTTDEVPGK